jgi:spore coat polysaccharide biosynthesis protein SpsF
MAGKLPMIPAEAQPVVCISQARMSSSRLPGKVMKPILGRPLLWWHLTRLKQARRVDRIVLAVADEPGQDRLFAVARELGVDAVAGPLHDVLERYRLAAEHADAATVIRVTSDCPLIDPLLIDETVARFCAARQSGGADWLDYLSVDISRLPRGLDTEIFPRALLDLAAAEAVAPEEREHVTRFIYTRPERFHAASWAPDGADFGQLRLCVDTPDDFEAVNAIYERASESERAVFGWRRAIDLAQ